MTLFAHSARDGKPSQLYHDHVAGVVAAACRNIENLSLYVDRSKVESYQHVVSRAAIYHDLGKLNWRNQEVLSGKKKAKHLPVEHRDAGVSHLMGSDVESPSSILIYAHHRPGLPNLIEEKTKPFPFRFLSAMEDTDAHLKAYLKLHHQAVGDVLEKELTIPAAKMSALEYRILLSSLVDADYIDSAGEQMPNPEKRWVRAAKSAQSVCSNS